MNMNRARPLEQKPAEAGHDRVALTMLAVLVGDQALKFLLRRAHRD